MPLLALPPELGEEAADLEIIIGVLDLLMAGHASLFSIHGDLFAVGGEDGEFPFAGADVLGVGRAPALFLLLDQDSGRLPSDEAVIHQFPAAFVVRHCLEIAQRDLRAVRQLPSLPPRAPRYPVDINLAEGAAERLVGIDDAL